MAGVSRRIAVWENMPVKGLPSTYEEAVAIGSDYYFIEPCQRGHTVPRRTKLRDCPRCTQMRDRGELIRTGELVKVFSMLVDLSKRQVGFRGLQDSKQIEEDIDYDTCNEYEVETTSSCPFDGRRRVSGLRRRSVQLTS